MAVLLGRTSAGTSSDFNGVPQTTAWKFTAVASGDLSVLKAQTKVANGTATGIGISVWDDTAGGARPGARLGSATADVLATARGTGVWTATLGATIAITSGTVYWLAWFSATENFDFQGDSSGSYVENASALPIATPWPSAGNGSGSLNAIIWGEDAGAGPGPTAKKLAVQGVG